MISDDKSSYKRFLGDNERSTASNEVAEAAGGGWAGVVWDRVVLSSSSAKTVFWQSGPQMTLNLKVKAPSNKPRTRFEHSKGTAYL
jgi:hypothetical protein